MKDLLLVGGGHSHVAVLKQFGMRPHPDVRITLVSRGFETPYSGMLPGLIAGHYTHDEAHIDLQRLARFAGARALFDEVTGLDPVARVVTCARHPPVSYDLLSINVGSTPNVSTAGAADYATPVKPIDRFLDRWTSLRDRVLADDRPRRIAVVGGGAGGVELLLAVQYRLRRLLERQGRRADHLEYHLFTATDTILPTHNERVRRMFERIFAGRGVEVHLSTEIVRVAAGQLQTRSGEIHGIEEVLWTTEARAPAWIAAAGLATDQRGFVAVAPTLQSTSHPEVFAAGDVAAMVGRPLEKSGVYAVRQGRVLASNLRRAIAGGSLRPYRPQRRFLSLISTGDRFAVGSRGRLAFQGRWAWQLKDRIDRAFMRKYNELPDMEAVRLPPAPRLRRSQKPDTTHSRNVRLEADLDQMRCGGCGAKVGAEVLARALSHVQPVAREDVLIGLGAADDAAVVDVPSCKAMVHTVDFFRAILDDPYVFGRIAATHALGDLYAMGAEPQTALAIVTIPFGSDRQVEETLRHLLAGASEVLGEDGVALAGGHTSEGSELGLGFAVNGLVERGRILRKGGLHPGDRLVLTKPIGTGALFAADMRHRARGAWIAAAIASMTRSSRAASASLLRHGATACTDVTGFGLLGHLLEMVRASDVDIELDLAAIPVLDGAEAMIRSGIRSSMHPQNAGFRRSVFFSEALETSARFALLCDPQTAGGLAAGVPAGAADLCLAELRAAGYRDAAVIGTVLPRGTQTERVRCIV